MMALLVCNGCGFQPAIVVNQWLRDLSPLQSSETQQIRNPQILSSLYALNEHTGICLNVSSL